jgi:hypothetical protein
MQHKEFAERAAEHLEVVADAIEDADRRIGRHAVSSVRANEMRVAARMVRDMAQAVTWAEDKSLAEPLVEDLSLQTWA